MSKSYWGEVKLMNDFGILAFLVGAQMWEEVGDAPSPTKSRNAINFTSSLPCNTHQPQSSHPVVLHHKAKGRSVKTTTGVPTQTGPIIPSLLDPPHAPVA